jgi:Domain of unknown function (DUF4160)
VLELVSANDLDLLRHCRTDVLARSRTAACARLYQGFEALVEIETGEIIRGRLPPAAATLMKGWVLARRDALHDN